MNLPITKQIEFLQWQIKEMEVEYISYLNTNMNAHFRAGTAYFGKFWGVDEARGNLIIQFPKKITPRLNNHYSAFLFKGINENQIYENWNFSYSFFREKYAVLNFDMLPIYYTQNNGFKFNYIGFKDVDYNLISKVKKWLSEGKSIPVIIAEKDPPYKYLENLISFIETNTQDAILNINIDRKLEDWSPIIFKEQEKIEEKIIDYLEVSNELIIQGPPGTGKSTLIAKIADYYLTNGNNVCITSLTNKALIEIAEKQGIQKNINLGKVYKTNLTGNEAKQVSRLKNADKLIISKDELLLATYYKLSNWYNSENDVPNFKAPIYDLIIIEEASQCYLATIAAFKKLGSKILVVGDPYQLPPIVLNENNATSIHPKIMNFAHGLSTYVSNSNINAYTLTTTYRLSNEAAKLTGIFYKNRLLSAKESLPVIQTTPEIKSVVPINGDTIIKFMDIITEGDKPLNAIDYISFIVVKLRNENPKLEIAILAPFKKTILGLQESISSKIIDQSRITIETIDRIQGLSVDFCIFLIPLNNPSFALNLNRFNVATSRSKGGTLIITDKEYVRFKSVNTLVTNFLSIIKEIE